MNKKPLLSIIIPVYNVEKFLDETIRSFLNDDFYNFEIIAIDDCSKDNSFKILEEYAKHNSRVKVYKNKKNVGKNNVINYGFTLANGDYIALFDSDDINILGRLKKQVEFLNNDDEIDMVYGDILIYRMNDNTKKIQKAAEFQNIDEPCKILKSLYGDNKRLSEIKKASQILHPTKYIPASSAIFRRKIIDDGIRMDEKLRNTEDLDFWLQIIGANFKIKHLPLNTYIYRIHSDQKSKNKNMENIAMKDIVNKLKKGVYFKD